MARTTHTTTQSPAVTEMPNGRVRLWINLLIVAFLTFHLFRPLAYYLGEQALDERFAWRFFSSVSLQSHEFSVDERTKTNAEVPSIPMDRLLRVGAVKKLLNTHHPDIVHRFLLWRVAQTSVAEVRYRRRTTTVGGRQLPTVNVWVDSGGNVQTSTDVQ